MNTNTFSIFWNLVVDLPMLITLVICMVFVFMRWKKLAKVAWLALIGLVLLFLHTLVFDAIYALVPEVIPRFGSTSGLIFSVSLINFMAMAVAFAFLLIAAFVGRGPARAPLG